MAKQPLLERIRMLAAKVETTPGTAVALTAAEATHIVLNPSIEDVTEKVKREMQGSMGFHPSPYGPRIGEIKFTLHMCSESTTPSWAALFLPACGLGATLTPTYARAILLPSISGSTQKTLTLGFYNDGVFEQLHGAMGTAVFHFKAGEIVAVDFTFRGIYTQPADVAILAPTFVDYALLRFANSGFSIGGTDPKVSMIDLDLGNRVEAREDANAAAANHGMAYFFISDFETILRADPEMPLVADHDIAGLFALGTQAAVDFKALTGSDSATFTMTLGEIIECKRAARKGMSCWNIAVRDSNADLTITFAT